MKVIEINSVKNGSTGNIMKNIANTARKEGIEVYTACAGNLYQRRLPTDHPEYHIYIGGVLENKLHKTLGTIFGNGGCYSQWGTFLFLKKIDKIKPDIIHIHNLHSNYIHIGMLFHYIKKRHIKIIWTLHDCWSFTGHCPYFDVIQCDKWKQECSNCKQYKQYPESFRDDSKKMFIRKKKWFTDLKDVVLVTPSKWLEGLIKESFLKEYPVQVIYNGIDLKTFSKVKSTFKEKNGIKDKFVVLGVAFGWGYRKGLDVFVELSKRLDKNFKIVLVGVNETLRKTLPPNILTISFTNSVYDLIDIYSAADILVNPTREENFPTTHLEALACELPVITFNSGGASESLTEFCGAIVEKNNVDELEKKINEFRAKKVEGIICRRQAEQFDSSKKFKEYVKLIQDMGV